MGITRRQALKGSLGALFTIPFMGISSPKPVLVAATHAEQLVSLGEREQALKNIEHRRMARLLKRCSNAQRYDEEANHQFAVRMHKGMLEKILRDTGLEYRERDHMMCNQSLLTTDHGAAIDWLHKYAREARWDVVGRSFDIMAEMVARKVNSEKQPGSFISDFQLWEDPCMWKQRRMGFYCWAELETPFNDGITIT